MARIAALCGRELVESCCSHLASRDCAQRVGRWHQQSSVPACPTCQVLRRLPVRISHTKNRPSTTGFLVWRALTATELWMASTRDAGQSHHASRRSETRSVGKTFPVASHKEVSLCICTNDQARVTQWPEVPCHDPPIHNSVPAVHTHRAPA